jgi:hypothetical protein
LFKNPRREAVIYDHWKNGRTVDDISLIERIPRSSVGYYVKKFNKKGKKLGTLKVPRESEFEKIMMLEVQLSLFFLDELTQMMKENKFREIKETIESYFLLEKFIRNLCKNVGEGIDSSFVRQNIYGKLGINNFNKTAKWLFLLKEASRILKKKY